MNDTYEIITAPEVLDTVCQQAMQRPSVALDTEFVWERTFYPQLCLIQMAFDDGTTYLIDTLALTDLQPLGKVISSPDVELLLHDAGQDLQIISRHTGAQPRRIFDTRRAAGFAAMGATLSLAALIQETLGIYLEKGETRSDWSQRPLSKNQCDYAADDVFHLHEAAARIREAAHTAGNTHRLAEEMARFDNAALYDETTVDTLFKRFSTSRWQNDARKRLYCLVEQREAIAKRQNQPRSHILKDPELMAIAWHGPTTAQQLDTLREVAPRTRQRYRGMILEALQSARDMDDGQLPVTKTIRLPSGLKGLVSDRIEQIKKQTEAASIDPALIGSRAELTALTIEDMGLEAAPPPPEHLRSGWRCEFIPPLPVNEA